MPIIPRILSQPDVSDRNRSLIAQMGGMSIDAPDMPDIEPTPAPILPPIQARMPRSSLGDAVAPGEKIAPSQMNDAGKAAYEQMKPAITAAPGSTDYYRQRQQQLEFGKEHPWGAPISAQPGTGGKIGHILGRIANIAGDIFAPGVMANIPGTQLNKEREEQENLAGIAKGTQLENQTTEAEAQKTRAETEQEKANQPTTKDIHQHYADAVADAISRKVDPSTDPIVRQWADAITSIQKETAPKPAHITYDSGIPVTVTDSKGNVYDVNDPKLPPELKPLVDAANRAHRTHVTEETDKQARAEAAAARRSEHSADSRSETVANKRYETALDAEQRLSRMEAAYQKGLKGDQQAMLSLLTDHIGMTLGMQKGARITKDILNEATQSQPWLAKIKSRFDDRGYLSGVTLGPEQMKQMLELGYGARDRAVQGAYDASQLYGVEPPKGAKEVFGRRKIGEMPALQEGGGTVKVQIPGHPAGEISKTKLKAFKEKYPNAIELPDEQGKK